MQDRLHGSLSFPYLLMTESFLRPPSPPERERGGGLLWLYCGSAARRWRRASYRQTPDATDTFRLSTEPNIGMLTKRSQVSRVRRRMPSPSEPITSAVGPVKSPW